MRVFIYLFDFNFLSLLVRFEHQVGVSQAKHPSQKFHNFSRHDQPSKPTTSAV